MDLARVGHFLKLLGFIGIVRLVPELVTLRWARPIYYVVAGLDLILAVMMIISGAGLRFGKSWAPRLTLRSAGLVLATSLGWGILLGSEVLQNWRAGLGRQGLVLAPRLLFYVMAVAFLPYAVRVILRGSAPESPSSLRNCFIGWAVVGAVLMAFFFVIADP